VVANRFPALRPAEGDAGRDEGPFRCRDGYGAHEVIIESPDHERALAELEPEQVARILSSLQSRFRALFAEPRIQAVIAFENHGQAAGTSLRHPHLQIIATPVVPRLLRLRQEVAAEYFDATGRSLYEELARAEIAAGERMVELTDEYAAFVPYAAHLPFEVWILPRFVGGSFAAVEPERLAALARVLRSVLRRLSRALGDPALNVNLHTPPRDGADLRYFPWHVTLSPRIAVPAGFELGSGMAINTALPEEAAAILRGANG
jgi:UDPglucose--hexose-1-phosphate uridylyltransferase